MRHPVITADGYCYEKEAFIRYLKEHKNTSPQGVKFPQSPLYQSLAINENYILKQLVDEFQNAYRNRTLTEHHIKRFFIRLACGLGHTLLADPVVNPSGVIGSATDRYTRDPHSILSPTKKSVQIPYTQLQNAILEFQENLARIPAAEKEASEYENLLNAIAAYQIIPFQKQKSAAYLENQGMEFLGSLGESLFLKNRNDNRNKSKFISLVQSLSCLFTGVIVYPVSASLRYFWPDACRPDQDAAITRAYAKRQLLAYVGLVMPFIGLAGYLISTNLLLTAIVLLIFIPPMVCGMGVYTYTEKNGYGVDESQASVFTYLWAKDLDFDIEMSRVIVEEPEDDSAPQSENQGSTFFNSYGSGSMNNIADDITIEELDVEREARRGRQVQLITS